MIKLYIFPPAFGLRNVSPFSLKVELALKFLNLEYELVELSDPRQAPLAKLPYIDDDGEIVPDSELILDYLDKKTNGGLYGDLSPAERGIGTAMTQMVEHHLYWLMVASRWLDDDWFVHVKRDFFGALPGPMTHIVGAMARKQVKQTYKLHGLGGHSLATQAEFARRDFAAIDALLKEHSYIVADRLTVFDFNVAGSLAGILDQKPDTWMNPILNEFPKLKEYAESVQHGVGVYGRVLTS